MDTAATMHAQRIHAPSPTQIAELLSGSDLETGCDELDVGSLVSSLASARFARGAPRTRLDAFVVEHGSALRSTPFVWSSRAARRSLGTRAARLVASGAETDVLVAVTHEIERQCDRSLRGLVRRGALGAWLAAAKAPVRTACAIEAATWASELLMLLAPERTGIRVGIADAWFDVPGAPVTLHARRDGASPTCEGTRGGIIRCSDGFPGPRAHDGLLVDGLVTALAADGRAPHRVLGAWPDAGVVVVADIGTSTLRFAARLLAQAEGIDDADAARRGTPIAA